MARLTESQRRRMRDEAARRKRLRMDPLTDQEMAAFLNVTYTSTWTSDSGGYDSSTGSCGGSGYSSGSYDSGSGGSSCSDSGSSSCGGGGGCD